MIVEDDADTRDLVAELFVSEGYAVRTAWDGEEGLRCMREQLPSLVLLDLQMPHVDGFELRARLLDPEIASVPVVVVTALQRSRVIGLRRRSS